MTKAVLRDGTRQAPACLAKRLEFAEALWDSLAAECGRERFPCPDEQRADLERRLTEADAGPVTGAPWV